MRFSVAFLFACGLAASSCGSNSPSAPSQPAAPPPPTTYTITGVITERASGRAIFGAQVRIESEDGSTRYGQITTDGGGNYSISAVPAGRIRLDLDGVGYIHSFTVYTVAGNMRLDGTLTLREVEYRLTGTAKHCAATYANQSGGTSQQGVNIPFSLGWTSPRDGQFLYMSCQIDQSSDRGTLTVSIYKNGTLFQSGVAVGWPNIATASGSY